MPIFWRYLFREFFKTFSLSLSGLIACLLITRFQDIAHFATLAGNFRLTLLFTLYQIPYILPFAIPISCLIASMTLFQKLSTSHELTALRSAGLSLKTIKQPLKFLALFLAIGNFLIVSELTPITRRKGNTLLKDLMSSNPLLVLEKNKQLKIKDSYIDMDSLEVGKGVKNMILVLSQGDHLALLSIESLQVKERHLIGQNVAYITPLSHREENKLPDLMVENQKTIEMELSALTPLLIPPSLAERTEYYPLKPLIESLAKASLREKSLAKGKYELMRRFFFPLLTLTFTFLGMSFGCQVGRNKTSQAIKTLIMASYAFLCFLASKSQHRHPQFAALFILILPHLPLLYLARRAEQRMNRGLE